MTAPLLPLAHNWIASVTRVQRWGTAILPHRDGTEQRVPHAATPAERLVYRFTTFTPEEASALLGILETAPARQVVLPRWQDAVRLTAAAAAGATSLAVEDVTDRASVAAGATVLLTRGPALSETVTLAAAAGTALTLASGTAAAWGAGTSVVPLVTVRLADPAEIERLGGPYAETTLTVDVEPDVLGLSDAGGEAETPVAASVVVRVDNGQEGVLSHSANISYRLLAMVFDAAGARIPGAPISWSASDPAIVVTPTLGDGEALVSFTGATGGPATVTATSGAASGAVTVSVSGG